MGSRRVIGTYIQCRRFSSSTLYHLYPSPYPPSVDSLLSLAVPPSSSSVRASYPFPPSARVYVFLFLFLFWKRDIRGRNRKRHGRVSNRYSVAVSYTADRDTSERARCNETDCSREVYRQQEYIQSRECASNLHASSSGPTRRRVV